MAEGNGKAGQVPALAEGELYLFVRLNVQTGAFSCLYTDLFSALALQKFGAKYLDQELGKALAPTVVTAIPAARPVRSFESLIPK